MAHRATALALTAAMMAALAAPAFAGVYYIGDGDITVTKKENGEVWVKQGTSDEVQDTDGNVTITGDKDKYDAAQSSGSGSTGSQNARQNGSDTPAPATLEADETPDPVVTEENTDDLTDPEPTPVVTWPEEAPVTGENVEKSPDPEQPETKTDGEETPQPAPEGAEDDTEGKTPESPVATLEAPAAMAVSTGSRSDDNNTKNYFGPADNALTRAASSAINNIIKIINNSKDTLNVTLEDVNISGEAKKDSALTVDGSGDTTLTLKGDNKLQGGAGGNDGLYGKSSGKLTITSGKNADGTYKGSLTTTGGSNANGSGGAGIRASGDLSIEGGILNATGGDATGGDSSYGYAGKGISASGTVTISGGNIQNAQGGEGEYGYGIYGGTVTIGGGADTATIEKASGGLAGIYSNGKLFIKDNANIKEAVGTGVNGNGLYSAGDLEITGGSVNATSEGQSGSGIRSGSDITIKNGTVTAVANDMYGCGIYADDALRMEGGRVTATANGTEGDGINSNSITIKRGTVIATANGKDGSGILGYDALEITGGNITATANGADGSGIDSASATITGGDITATATGAGGDGIRNYGKLAISNGNLTAKGSAGGNGIHVVDDDAELEISGNAYVTAIAGNSGYSLAKTDENDNTEALDPASVVSGNAILVTKDSKGNIIYSNAPETPETPQAPASSGSDNTPAPEAVVITPAGVSGIRFTTPQGRSVAISPEVRDTTLVYSTLRHGAAMHTTLGTLRQLRAQGITHITFRTLLCTTTFSLDELLAAHANDPDSTPVLLSHNGKNAALTVGGVEQ